MFAPSGVPIPASRETPPSLLSVVVQGSPGVPANLETDVFVGDVLRFPDCVLAVSQPRLPCFKLNAAMGFAHAAKLMVESAWCGWYLAVREPGTIAAGDEFDVVAGPREVSLWELFRARTGKGA